MKTLLTRFRSLSAMVGWSLLMLACFGASRGAAQMQTAAVPPGATAMGPVAGGATVEFTVYLRPAAAQQAAVRALIAAQDDPGSAAYRKWISAAEFGAEFGVDRSALTAYARGKGLELEEVGPGGAAVRMRGPASAVEAAFAPRLESYRTATGAVALANTAVPQIPASLVQSVSTIEGFNTLNGPTMAVSGRGGPMLETLRAAVESNAVRVLALTGAPKASDLSEGDSAALRWMLAEAAAQGISVIGEAGDAAGASGLAGAEDVLLVAPLAGVAGNGVDAGARPAWQVADGLPADALRASPDVAVRAVAEVATALEGVLAGMKPAADGQAARVGNIAGTVYELRVAPGLFTQADGAAAGTWETGTGLGALDVAKLGQYFPRGTLTDNVQISSSNYSPTHGQSFTLSANVTDTSGQGQGVAPSGTVTFTASNTGVTLGMCTLNVGVCNVTVSNAAGGSTQVKAYYSGDGTYVGNTSVTITISVQGEELNVTPTVTNSPAVGGTIVVSVSVSVPSGVGTPSGTVNVTPQGTAQTTTYSGTLAGSGSTATATVLVPATMAGSIVLVVQCVTTDPSFTCYKAYQATATVTQGTPSLTFTVTPNPPVTGQITMFTATVKGAANPAVQPTGGVTFYDNGAVIGNGQLSNGTASAQVSGLSATASHSFTATYAGDNNYRTVTAAAPGGTGAAATTTALAISPNPPTAGTTTTFTATVGHTGATAPTGTVQFYQDGTVFGQGTVANGVATYATNGIVATAAHAFYAVYLGDTNFATSTSPTVNTTPASSTRTTTTTLVVNPNPPVAGTTTSFTATVAYNSNGTAATGTVTFYGDSAVLGTTALSANGTATLTSTAISGNTSHSFYAVYAGDSNYATSTSTIVTTAANGTTATTTTLTLSPNPPTAGTTTVLRATVALASGGAVASAATGTVAFSQDGVQIGTAVLVSGVASYGANALDTTTTHVYTAKYLGDSTYQGSQSAGVTTAASGGNGNSVTSTAVTSSSPNQVAGGTTTFIALVTAATPVNGAVPSGTVTFTSNLQGVIGTVPLTGNQGTLSISLTTPGLQSVTARYNGDAIYAPSTSATPATVTVASPIATGGVLTISPTSTVTYGTPTTVTYTVSGITTTPAGGTPAGTVTLSSTNAAFASMTVPLVGTGTTASATFTLPVLTPGSYPLSAVCMGTNFTCPTVAATTALTVIKGNTTTTLTASPAAPVAGQASLLTATIAAVAPSLNPTNTFTGMVTFYNNGVSLGTGVVTGNTATFSTTLGSTTGNTVTAVYSGDMNWNTSTSAPLILVTPPVTTTSTLKASPTTALQGANVIFTVTVSVPTPVTTPATYANPTGTVTFYDTFNGQTTTLGTAPLVQSGPYQAIGQVSTTGLFVGTHSVYALYAATGAFGASTSNTVTVNITDYTLTLTPQVLALTAGGTGTVTATVTPMNGFAGTVTLGCTPPSGTYTTCSFSPTVLSPGGSSTLTITTTASRAVTGRPVAMLPGGAAVVLAGGMVWLLVPRRRRMASLLALLLTAGAVFGAAGCGTGYQNNFTSTGSNGTPLGTVLFSIVSSGSDGNTTNRHNTQLQVTVQ